MSIFDDVLETDKLPERAHSRFAPSSLKRILECPRSVPLSELIPQSGRASVYAAEGTVAHEVAEAYLCGRPVPEVGEQRAVDGFNVIVTYDMHVYGSEYADYVIKLMEPDDILYVEQTVRLDGIVGEDANMYGHLDAAVWSPHRRKLMVIDYKYGRGIVVDAYENPQLRAYALGAMYTLPDVDPDEVERVEYHVFQPRVSGLKLPAGESGKSLVEWGSNRLRRTIRDIVETGAATTGFTIGDHCRFCPARSICPALREHAKERAKRAFETSPLPPEDYSSEEIAACLDEADKIEAWIEAVREEALRRAGNGVDLPGYKLAERPGPRRWKREAPRYWKSPNAEEYNYDFTKLVQMSVAEAEKIVEPEDREAFKALWECPSPGKRLVKTREPAPRQPAHEVFRRKDKEQE